MFPNLSDGDIGTMKHKLNCMPMICAFLSMLYLDKSILENKPRNDELWDTVGGHPAQPAHVLLLATTEGGTCQKTS